MSDDWYINETYTHIGADSTEAPNVRVFYNGEEVTNCTSIELHGAGFKFKDKSSKVLNWRERMENG